MAGIYSVTVSDASNCAQNASYTIVQPSAISPTVVQTSITCFGGNDGAFDMTVSGGNGPFTFLWSNGATTEDLSNLSIGTYNVQITDANNCLNSSSFVMTQPALLNLSNTHTNVLCNGISSGTINLTVIGGISPYNYSWSNGATTEDILSIGAGVYNVVVTDGNGCFSNSSATITQPSILASSGTQSNILCYNGSSGAINLTVTGGVSPYSYQWNNGQTTEDINNPPLKSHA